MNQENLHDILASIGKDPKINDAFFDNLLSRKEWSKILEINRITLWRWEVNIINKIPPLKASYYETGKGCRSNYLDGYQRFLSATIFFLMKGKKYEEVKRLLIANFMHLRRKDFEQWRKQQ
ncbi:hypothetical protein LC613_38980 [Nostoc sphaeroides CHAB 2801]|uniref:hypothetical protein n=1 Tax=Nostoc sphaeroides TaxID=446679 RepID=UPI001E639BC9|nr:hypothetical protein [Nostoc sphaeroides]MCC5633452.1 hypothetical protein [Nostoc sphaeroides CHAB 2801]